jgi:hypothetical protein
MTRSGSFATVLVALVAAAACGNDSLHHTVDALPADVAIDQIATSSGDAPANAVKLTVTRNSAAVVNVAVFFQDPSSALIEQKLTDETGVAWALMPDGGFVTAIEKRGDGLYELSTFAGATSGDALQLAFAASAGQKSWPFKLAFPPATNGVHYQIYTSCGDEQLGIDDPGSAAPDTNIVSLTGCDDGVADFVIMAQDVNGVPTGETLVAEGVTLPAPPTGGMADASPPQYNTLTLPGPFGPFETHTLSYSNLSDAVDSLTVYQAIPATRRAFGAGDVAPRSGTTASTTLQMPAGATTMLTVTTANKAGQKGQQSRYDWGAASTTYTLDAATATLPPYASSPTFDPATRTVTWTEGSGSVQPDAIRAHIHGYRDDIPAGTSWGWRIVAPRTGTSITLPQLPVTGFDFNAHDTDTLGVDELTAIDVPGGYAAWRARGFTDIHRAVSAASGSISLQTLYFEEL